MEYRMNLHENKILFSDLIRHKQAFDIPENWRNKEITQSPLIMDFPFLWDTLRATYLSELSKLAFIPVPDEKEVAAVFTQIVQNV